MLRFRWRPKVLPQTPKQNRQEIHCHACDKWVQFIIDQALDGNHVLNCPNCGHEHCRVVKNGEITDFRWDQRNGPTYQAFAVTTSATSVYTNLLNVTQSTNSGSSGVWYANGTTTQQMFNIGS